MADDSRQIIAEELDSFISSEYGRELIKGIFSLEKAKWAYCPSCKKKVQVDTPDYRSITGSLAQLLDQGKGRTKETPPPDPKLEEERIRSVVRDEIRAALDDAT